MGEHLRAGDLDIWTEQVGEGPDVLLIGGGGDTVESWQFQLDGLADRYLRTRCLFVRWLVEVAPSERAFLEGFFLDIYTARAHNDGSVEAFIEEVLAFPHKQAAEDLQAFLDAFLDHDTTERLSEIAAPTLVLAGGRDPTARPPLCRAVAELIPGARFEVLEEEAHQPFQEVPEEWNARVDTFWREVEARG